MFHKIIPFLVVYIVKIVIFTQKSQRLSQIPKYFCQILMIHYLAIKKTHTFCINQKVNFGADLGAFFLSKRNVVTLMHDQVCDTQCQKLAFFFGCLPPDYKSE